MSPALIFPRKKFAIMEYDWVIRIINTLFVKGAWTVLFQKTKVSPTAKKSISILRKKYPLEMIVKNIKEKDFAKNPS